jgi:serine/threonine-protein kinase
MSALQHLTSVLFCIGATAATYLLMNQVVAPRLPIAAVEVPNLTGLTIDQARRLCDPPGLLLVVDGERTPEPGQVEAARPIPAGTLFDQHPLGGSRLRRGEKVHVNLALPPPPPRVPSLAGQTRDAAQARLRELGLRPGAVTEAASDLPIGLVVGTRPESGAEVRRDDPVDLIVSKGAEQVQVPNLRGKSVGAAEKLLVQAGLLLGDQRRGVDDNAGDGVVLRQTPAAGTMAPKGQRVDLVVNE